MVLIVIAVLMLTMGSLFKFKLSSDVYGGLIVLAVLLVMIGVAFPISGYSEATLESEYELMPVIDNTDVYVIRTNEHVLICKYSKDSGKNESADIVEYDSSVKVEIDNNISTPVIKTYSKKPKRSLWTFALVGEKIERVIYVPKEKIIS